jgi:hypothetical protein
MSTHPGGGPGQARSRRHHRPPGPSRQAHRKGSVMAYVACFCRCPGYNRPEHPVPIMNGAGPDGHMRGPARDDSKRRPAGIAIADWVDLALRAVAGHLGEDKTFRCQRVTRCASSPRRVHRPRRGPATKIECCGFPGPCAGGTRSGRSSACGWSSWAIGFSAARRARSIPCRRFSRRRRGRGGGWSPGAPVRRFPSTRTTVAPRPGGLAPLGCCRVSSRHRRRRGRPRM